MQEIVVITVISDDKPGVVEAIAQSINQCGGNWLESKLAQMAGKFVGVIQVSVEKTELERFENELKSLAKRGIHTTCEPFTGTALHTQNDSTVVKEHNLRASFHAVGPDRKGIIKELSSAFLAKDINVETLETKLSSMPYSGEPLFEASGLVDIPSDSTNHDKALNELHQRLDDIANELGIDISLSVNGGTT